MVSVMHGVRTIFQEFAHQAIDDVTHGLRTLCHKLLV